MYRVVTDLGVFGFDEKTRRMNVVALQSRRHASSRCRTTPASSSLFDDDIGVTEPPTASELGFLRKLDPERLYTA